MKQICMDCLNQYGIKEPFENDSETHGLCKTCWDKRIEHIKKRKEEMSREASRKNIGGATGKVDDGTKL
jgi:hypothetical protein